MNLRRYSDATLKQVISTPPESNEDIELDKHIRAELDRRLLQRLSELTPDERLKVLKAVSK